MFENKNAVKVKEIKKVENRGFEKIKENRIIIEKQCVVYIIIVLK